MDILLVNYRNYELLEIQLKHLEKLNGDKRILICDNTPINERKIFKTKHELYTLDVEGIDGYTHGSAIDFLIRKSTSEFICIMDTDFFWINKDIFNIDKNYKCIGCEGFYKDWIDYLDPKHPDRKGSLAPVCWGMIIERNLALSETFVVTQQEAYETRETGWRLREKIIKEHIPNIVFKGYYDKEDENICYFIYNNRIQGLHFLKGSGQRKNINLIINRYINKYSIKI